MPARPRLTAELSPAPVAVHDDADVAGQVAGFDDDHEGAWARELPRMRRLGNDRGPPDVSFDCMQLRRVRDWFVPTFAGSVLGFWVVTTAFCLMWGDFCDCASAGGKCSLGADWPCLLVRATGLGVALAVLSLVVDVALLRRGMRELPQARRAFWLAFAGAPVGQLLWIFPVWDIFFLPRLVTLLLQLALVAITVRLIFGRMPK
jgi:hypothetical protein